MKKVDMSSKAITERIKQVDELRKQCLLLVKTEGISLDEAKEIVNKRARKNLDDQAK